MMNFPDPVMAPPDQVKVPPATMKSPVPLTGMLKEEVSPSPPIVREPVKTIDPVAALKVPATESEIVVAWVRVVVEEESSWYRVRVAGPLKVMLELEVTVTSVRVAPPE